MIYLANDKYAGALSSGYTVGQSTLYVSAVPDNVPTIIVAGKGTDNETVFSVTGKTTNSLTGVTRLRGANVNLDSQTPLTCLNNEEFINQYATALFSAEGLKNLVYAADGGSTDAYAITLDPAPTSYTNLIGVPIQFKANTVNTGAASLNINGLDPIDIKKNYNVALEDGDIKANQLVQVAFDGTYFQLLSPISTLVSASSTNTFTNKRITKRIQSVTSASTVTPNADNDDEVHVTALAAACQFQNPTGTPTDGQIIVIRVLDNATARALTFQDGYFFGTDFPAPTTTVLSKTMYMVFKFNSARGKWDCVDVVGNF